MEPASASRTRRPIGRDRSPADRKGAYRAGASWSRWRTPATTSQGRGFRAGMADGDGSPDTCCNAWRADDARQDRRYAVGAPQRRARFQSRAKRETLGKHGTAFHCGFYRRRGRQAPRTVRRCRLGFDSHGPGLYSENAPFERDRRIGQTVTCAAASLPHRARNVELRGERSPAIGAGNVQSWMPATGPILGTSILVHDLPMMADSAAQRLGELAAERWSLVSGHAAAVSARWCRVVLCCGERNLFHKPRMLISLFLRLKQESR